VLLTLDRLVLGAHRLLLGLKGVTNQSAGRRTGDRADHQSLTWIADLITDNGTDSGTYGTAGRGPNPGRFPGLSAGNHSRANDSGKAELRNLSSKLHEFPSLLNRAT
jgi:hypothetical protein